MRRRRLVTTRLGNNGKRGTSMGTENASGPRIVVGVDGSAESVEALRWAAAYATATGGTISAVLSWHYPTAAGIVQPGAAPKLLTDDVRATMQEALDGAVAEVFGTTTPPSVHPKIVYGHPAVVLVDESHNADLVVVGNRGHGAFAGMLTGSVSNHCVNNTHCPVVVVRGTA
jgi:nucleotide-binding universal stress UspA family protein